MTHAPSFLGLLQALSPVMTAPSFSSFLTLLAGLSIGGYICSGFVAGISATSAPADKLPAAGSARKLIPAHLEVAGTPARYLDLIRTGGQLHCHRLPFAR